jgi:hypothetical protein
MKINYQNEKGITEFNWKKNDDPFVIRKLSNKRECVYLVMTGQMPITHYPREFFVTSSALDVAIYLDSVAVTDIVWIQEFEKHEQAVVYLVDMYECMPDLSPSNN